MRDHRHRVVNRKGRVWLTIAIAAMALSSVAQRDKCLSVCAKGLTELQGLQEHAKVYAATPQSHIVQQGTLLT
jgi:hypothetical protein